MKSGLFLIIFLVMGISNAPLVFAGPKLFHKNSLEEITNSRQQQPFLLVLWSVDCPPCFKEFELLQKMASSFSARNLVLISTDDEQNSDEVERVLEKFSLSKFEHWIFADTYTERLRYKIDPQWFGELPRAYFYPANHQRIAKSGTLTQQQLNQWIVELSKL